MQKHAEVNWIDSGRLTKLSAGLRFAQSRTAHAQPGVALLLWVCQGQELDGAVASRTLDHILCKQRLRKSDEDETLSQA